MLKQLHIRLTILSTAITGIILAVMAVMSLMVSESRLANTYLTAFEANINSIINKLQSDQAVSLKWLAQTEASSMLIVHIEDNMQPLFFHGGWKPLTPRSTLVEAVKKKALEEYGFRLDSRPISGLEASSVFFPMQGEQGEHYLCAAAVIPSARGWQSLTVLRDMQEEENIILRQRLLFILLTVAGILVLFGFSWWFSGRAIRPVAVSQKKQVEFVAAASHELRSPLAVIRASASAALEEPEKTEHFLGNIERECSRMGRLLEDLLLLAGTDAKTWTLHPAPIDLDSLLIETTELFFPIAAEREQTISLEFPDDPFPPVEGDYQRLQQALSVLIDNALSYTPSGGSVTVQGEVIKGFIHITVSDTGPGIPHEHREMVFDRFYRVNKSRSDKQHFGLGLSIARELVQLHGGHLYLAESPRQAKEPAGAAFVIELPIKKLTHN